LKIKGEGGGGKEWFEETDACLLGFLRVGLFASDGGRGSAHRHDWRMLNRCLHRRALRQRWYVRKLPIHFGVAQGVMLTTNLHFLPSANLLATTGRTKQFSGRMANVWRYALVTLHFSFGASQLMLFATCQTYRLLSDITFPTVSYTTGHEVHLPFSPSSSPSSSLSAHARPDFAREDPSSTEGSSKPSTTSTSRISGCRSSATRHRSTTTGWRFTRPDTLGGPSGRA
jgi:hypothetical protein